MFYLLLFRQTASIIMWLHNTIILTISTLFGSCDDPKYVCDMLASCCSIVDCFKEYQLMFDLYNLKREPSQNINDFFVCIQFLWDQISLSYPSWKCLEDAQLYVTHACRVQHRLYQFQIALCDDCKLVLEQLLYCSPLPSLENALIELVKEDTQL